MQRYLILAIGMAAAALGATPSSAQTAGSGAACTPPVYGGAVQKGTVPNQPKANNAAEKALYDAASAQGLIRYRVYDKSLRADIVDIVEINATGTWNGEKVEKVTLGYDAKIPAARIDVTKTGGQREIQVAAGKAVWDESKPGVFLKAATATPADRLKEMYLMPWGLVLAGTQALDKVSVEEKGGARILKVMTPIGAEVAATVDKSCYPIHTEMTFGGKSYSADFSNIVGDAMDYDVYFPGRITIKVDGKVTADLTVIKIPADKETNPGVTLPEANAVFVNPYMPFPVPKEVAAR